MDAVNAIFGFLWDLLYFLTGEGSWVLRPHERIVLEAAVASLPNDKQIILRTQLGQKMFVQRSHGQICRPRFYSAFYVRNKKTTEDDDLSNKVINIQISVDGENQNAQVEFFQGRIDSIQFKRPSKFYIGKEVKVIGVKLGNTSLTHAAAIDRCEHGREH